MSPLPVSAPEHGDPPPDDESALPPLPRWKRWWPWLAAALSGLLLTICYPRFEQGWLVWSALTPLICAAWFRAEYEEEMCAVFSSRRAREGSAAAWMGAFHDVLSAAPKASAELLPLASAAADLQYSIQFQERVRRLFNAWLSAHIAFSIIFYLLLSLHIWAGIYFGLRWFR